AAGHSVPVAPSVAPAGTAGGAAGRTPGGFARLVERQDLTPAFVALSLLAAMAWGATHALGPGHGKTIVGAYLVGSRGTARHALALGLAVTATHTSSVVALGLVTLYASRHAVAEDLYLWLSVASGLLVLAMGAGLFWTRLRALRRRGSAAAFHHHDHHAGHPHGHEAPHHHDHAPAPGWRGLLMIGVSGGLLPCPTAIVVMLGTIALDRIPFGLALIGAFSFGLAAVLTAVGLALVYARRLLEAPGLRLQPLIGRARPVVRLAPAVPVLSAIAILAAGLVLTGQALAAL
ncbi:MAG TPA: nickel transporter, partial [Dehalococcoidia bacterium]|nr:nickel transporter [Dehalococcoidia bacterium]